MAKVKTSDSGRRYVETEEVVAAALSRAKRTSECEWCGKMLTPTNRVIWNSDDDGGLPMELHLCTDCASPR